MRMDEISALEELRAAYRENWPILGELIFTGACEFQCQHCVYPPSYARFNRGVGVEQWLGILDDISRNLGIRTFVYGGRSVTADGLEVLAQWRQKLPGAHIGLIDNGISMSKDLDRLLDVRPDWIDISLDGQELEHDLQRGRDGSFRSGLEGAHWLVRNGAAPKVNILTCLTTLNRSSVVPMVLDLYDLGFRNFFITPITIVDGIRPPAELRLSGPQFAAFVSEVRALLERVDDAWIEINLFSAEYAEYVARLLPEVWNGFAPERDSLVWREGPPPSAAGKSTEFFIRYSPTSLTGTRELIVNTNGDVIMPKSMAAGRIADEHVLGNLLAQRSSELVEAFADSAKLGFFARELVHEQKLLKRFL